jgi:hypothetical protein
MKSKPQQPKAFQALKIVVPESFARVQLTIQEFHRLADKLDFSPVLEDPEGFAFIDGEENICFFAKKEGK